MRAYAGIGSRRTPWPVLEVMEAVAAVLAADGLTLRSGHAAGADQAFERGAGGKAQIFLPWRTFNGEVPVSGAAFMPSLEAQRLAEHTHPAWGRLSMGARLLHARNGHQILGPGLDDPVEFVVCWTPDVVSSGGTAQALRLAEDRGIRVWNLSDPDVAERFSERLASRGAL